jgi:hypothetical protein
MRCCEIKKKTFSFLEVVYSGSENPRLAATTVRSYLWGSQAAESVASVKAHRLKLAMSGTLCVYKTRVVQDLLIELFQIDSILDDICEH